MIINVNKYWLPILKHNISVTEFLAKKISYLQKNQPLELAMSVDSQLN